MNQNYVSRCGGLCETEFGSHMSEGTRVIAYIYIYIPGSVLERTLKDNGDVTLLLSP